MDAAISVELISHTGPKQPRSIQRYRKLLETHVRDFVIQARPGSGTYSRSEAASVISRYVGIPLGIALTSAHIVHVIDQGLAWYAPFVRRRAPVIVTAHDLIGSGNEAGYRRRWLAKRSLRCLEYARTIIAVSCHTADSLRLAGIPRDNITVVHNMVDPTLFRPRTECEREKIRERWCSPAERLLVHVSRKAPYKRRDEVFRVFARVLSTGIRARLLLPGEGPSSEEIKNIRRMNINDSVTYCGTLDDDSLSGLYASAGAYVCTSSKEGFCFPVAEAMACGCPVVSTKGGAVPEVAGNAALLSDVGDFEALSNNMIRILRNQDLATELRERGLVRASRFAPSQIIPGLCEVYRGVL